MSEVTLTVKLTVDGDPERMAALLTDYLTNPENPFLTDYGVDAWGGWEGPFVTEVVVL